MGKVLYTSLNNYYIIMNIKIKMIIVSTIILIILLSAEIPIVSAKHIESDKDEQLLNNSSPFKPVVDGSQELKPGEVHTYGFYTEDPDNDELYYVINWNCYCGARFKDWGPFPSGHRIELQFQWPNGLEEGMYRILVKAKDFHGAESEITSYHVTVKKEVVRSTPSELFLIIQNYFPILFKLVNTHFFTI
jgi:hypothetical protein